ncbi:cyclin-A1-1 isoform X2 [Vitis vinifera]|uniref:cyclin-A1-1 isoform X2 n=1 Tax=Vitis vinifera TaxID=29760 RepID=UPI0008FEBCA9|nr:cyclin-A1-1 isoform X2 [Vitis vinifera]|eukprot:XP_019072151.1 PREDICTED: cyclin-A1-1 isoform X2 [Vitis vinifera]
MSTQNRRSSVSSSSSSSSLMKRSSSDNHGKVTTVPSHLAKKRPPLSNITNQKNASLSGLKSSAAVGTMVPCAEKISKAKRGSSKISRSVGITGNTSSASLNVKPTAVIPSSMDETMSTCDSFKSPEVEYMDVDDLAVNSIERKTCSKLYISEHVEAEGNICSEDIHVETETNGKIADIDDNFGDPQFCATMACDIYKHLRASEARKRPSTDFMERIQKDVNASMRSILIDWLVEVAEEYRLVPDTLYLTVNFIDRYLSGNVMNRQQLQLLGVACMMIAAKYEEICAPQVEEFCYITDNTYFKEEVLQMESSVLNYLKFEMTAPTAKCFLRRFVRAAQGMNEVPSLQLECLANYIAELSLLEYSMLCYAPSLIAASAIFLANYILLPSKRPWNSTLRHYTLYQPSDLCDCVKALHRLCCNNHNSSLPAIREKYSQHKYKFVAKKYCPPSIPSELFHNLSN